MEILKKIDKIIVQLEIGVLVALLLEMTILSFVQIVLRNTIHFSFIWADVIVRWSVLWAAIIGASIAVTEKGHIKIDIMSHLIPKPYDEYLEALLTAIAFFITTWIAKVGYEFILTTKEVGKTVDPLPVKEWVFCLIFPIGFGILAFKFFLLFLFEVEKLRGAKKPEAGSKAEA